MLPLVASCQGHEPDYTVFTLRDWGGHDEIMLIGAVVSLTLVFFLVQKSLRMRAAWWAL